MTESTLPDGDPAPPTAVLVYSATALQETLDGLAENLVAAGPTPVGLTMTVVLDGVAVTLPAGDRHSAVASSVVQDLPNSTPGPRDPDSMVALFAAQIGDFADLATVVSRSAGADTPAQGGHTFHSLEVTDLAEFSARNQAIGVLVDRGHTPDEARLVLQRRATSNSATLIQTAQDILDDLTDPAAQPRSTPWG